MAKITDVPFPQLDNISEAELWQTIILIRQIADIGNLRSVEKARHWLTLASETDLKAFFMVKLGRLLNDLGDTREGVN